MGFVTISPGGLDVYLGESDGTFHYATSLPNPLTHPIAWVTVGDANNDGIPDIMCGDTAGMAVYLGNGDGTFRKATHFIDTASGYGITNVMLADVNGDGNLDAVGQLRALGAGPYAFGVLFGDGKGDFTFNLNTVIPVQLGYGGATAGHAWVTPTLGDFNGDGKLDLLVPTENTSNGTFSLTDYLGNGNGLFTPGPIVYSGAGGADDKILVGDLNGDSKLDLVAFNTVSGGPTASVYLGDGHGGFSLASTIDLSMGNNAYGNPILPGNLALGDFSGDGKLDLAVSYYDVYAQPSVVRIYPGDGTGHFGTPQSVTVGENPFTLVSLPRAPFLDAGTFAVTDHAPVANDDTATVTPGSSVSIPILANDSDPDNDPLTITQVGAPGHGVAHLNGADHTIIYTPAAGFTGTDTFTYTIADPAGVEATATVTVLVANDPPVGVDDQATTTAGAAVTVQVLANDSDPGKHPLTVTGVSTPAHGTAVISHDPGGDTVVYTPSAGFTGTDTFTYTITDSVGLTATATVTVRVAPLLLGENATTGALYALVPNGSSFTLSARGNFFGTNPNWVNIVSGDFTGDGKADVAAQYAPTGQWYVGVSNGSSFTFSLWGAWQPGVWKDVLVGDFDGSGRDSIAGRYPLYANGGKATDPHPNDSVYVLLSTGSSFVTSLWDYWYPDGGYTGDPARGDPNINWLDTRVGDFNGAVSASGHRIDDLASGVLLYDIGPSGQPAWFRDIFVAESSGASFTQHYWHSWSAAPPGGVGANWVGVQVGDFDGDGKDDLAERVQQNGTVWLSLNYAPQTTRGFSGQTFWQYWAAPQSPIAALQMNVTWLDVQVADFDGTGRAGLVARRSDNNALYVSRDFTTPPSLYYYGDPSHPASPGQQLWTTLPGASADWGDLMVGDFNGDGKADVAARYTPTGQWFVSVSTGTSFSYQDWGVIWDPRQTWIVLK
jgi:hypothetical protein